MRVSPACNLPSFCYGKGGDFLIVNLQKTPYDNNCTLRIFSKIDDFMKQVTNLLNINVEEYKADAVVQALQNDIKNVKLDPTWGW